ncbi:MAG: TIR domain-containing protein [Sphingomonas sp.]|nr:TIR domain-containing protein [Sphingomonas sp.]MBW0006729.1 TIR domain-containing protein [Sphingomonas sp.]
MAKLARLPLMDRSAEADSARIPRLRTRYYAFLSYSHKDKELADWLHRELEKFRVPSSLAGKLTANGVVPRRLTPVFRDQQDLSAGADLGEEIKAALAASQFLVVLCSPTAATSRWTNAEIENFKRTRPEGCVLAAVVAGEPFASEIPGREAEECFPPALRYKYDRRGHQTTKKAEPLAADFRESGEGKRLAFLKLVAGMLGIGLDELVQRETTRRHRRMAWLAAASLGGMAVTSTLAVVALQSRNEAREQRREAEGLVAFMLGDLKDKLEPIGRLDALDGVGSRVLAYYSKQDASTLTDAALTQRSKALSLMAEVADARGDSTASLKLYREAMAGTAEAMRRDPSNAESVFEHAQNVFYVGEISRRDGNFEPAENAFREYQRLAKIMVDLQPDNMKYRMERQYADTNLGVVLSDQRRFAEAVPQFKDALNTIEAISTADPANRDYQEGVAESVAWLADAERAAGNYDRAIALRRRNLEIYNQLFAETSNVKYRQQAIPAMRSLGNLYAERGQSALAEQQFRTAIAQAQMLTAIEPDNTLWLEYSYRAQISLAGLLLALGRRDEAATLTTSASQAVHQLLKRENSKPKWRSGFFSVLSLQARLASAAGNQDQALSLAQQALSAARSIHSADKAEDAFRSARAYRLIGDIQKARGNLGDAFSNWSKGLAAIPAGIVEQPDELAEHAGLLQRLGRGAAARPIIERMNSIGYRLPV